MRGLGWRRQAVNEFAEYDGVREDNGSEGSDENDAWDVCAVPSLFTTPSTRRVFRVQRVGRVGGNHRPSFEYFGCVVEPTSRGADRALATADAVVERDLTLCLRCVREMRRHAAVGRLVLVLVSCRRTRPACVLRLLRAPYSGGQWTVV
jgi:hypothetical protein